MHLYFYSYIAISSSVPISIYVQRLGVKITNDMPFKPIKWVYIIGYQIIILLSQFFAMKNTVISLSAKHNFQNLGTH